MSSRKVKTCEKKAPKIHFQSTCSTSKKAQIEKEASCENNDLQRTGKFPPIFTKYLKALGEVAMSALTPDEELDAAYSNALKDTEARFQNLMDMKSQMREKPQQAVFQTAVGQKGLESRKRLSKPSVTEDQHKLPQPFEGTIYPKIQSESEPSTSEVPTASITPGSSNIQKSMLPVLSDRHKKVRKPKRKLQPTNDFGKEMFEIPLAFDFCYQQKPDSPVSKKRILDFATPSPDMRLEPEYVSSCEEPPSKGKTKFSRLLSHSKSLKTVHATHPIVSKTTVNNLTENLERKEVQLEGKQMEENTSRSRLTNRVVSNAAEQLTPKARNEDSEKIELAVENNTVERLDELSTIVVDGFSRLSVVEEESQRSKSSTSSGNRRTDNCFSQLEENFITVASNDTTFATALADSYTSSKISITSEYNTPPKTTEALSDPKKLLLSSFDPQTTTKATGKYLPKIKNIRDFGSTQSDNPPEALDYNGNTILKKWPPIGPQTPTVGSVIPQAGPSGVKLKGGLQEKTILKNKFSKASSSSSLYSSCSSIFSAETIVNKGIKLPKHLTSSRERLGSCSPNSNRYGNDPDNELELKKEDEIRRLKEKQEEVVRKKQVYIQQKQEMQRMKNAMWKTKVDKKKQEEAEALLTLEKLKVNLAGLDGKKASDKYGSLLKSKINPKLFSVVQKHFKEPMMAAATSCPDINSAILKKEAHTKPRLMSQVESSTSTSGFQKLAIKPNTGTVETPQLARNFVSQQSLSSKLLTDEEEDDDIFESAQDAEHYSEINTYDITVYEDYHEDLEYREKKRIPEWASNVSQLKRSLFLQQPKLMEVIPKSKSIFPKKNFGDKMFTDIPK